MISPCRRDAEGCGRDGTAAVAKWKRSPFKRVEVSDGRVRADAAQRAALSQGIKYMHATF